MPSSKLLKFCRIYQWIEKHDPELAECIRDLCLEGALTPYRGIGGITFLMPDKGSPLRNNIIKYTYSNKEGEDATMASKLIESLIVTDLVPDIKSFEFVKSKNSPLGNRLRYKLDINTIKNGNVLFKNGLRIEPINDFNTIAKKEYNGSNNRLNLAIWKIIEGEPPIEGEKVEPRSVIMSNKPGKEGGADSCLLSPMMKLVDNYRAEVAANIEKSFLSKIDRRSTYKNNDYLVIVTKIIKHLYTNRKDTYVKIKPILDIDPVINFYLLIEPYKTDNSYLIPKEDLRDDELKYLLELPSNDSIIMEYKEFLFQRLNTPSIALFSDSQRVLNNIHAIRNELLNKTVISDMLTSTITFYRQIEQTNGLNGINSLLPESLYQHYKTNPNKKLWQDEYRFLLAECLRNLKIEPNKEFSKNIFINLVNNLKENIPGNDYVKELHIMNNDTYVLTSCIKDKKKILQYFITSSDFLFLNNGLDVVSNQPDSNEFEYLQFHDYKNRNMTAISNLENHETHGQTIDINELRNKLKENGISDDKITNILKN